MEKRALLFAKLMMPLGLLLIVATSLFNRFFIKLPDFGTGLLMGGGIGIMIASLIKQKRLKQQSQV